MRSPGNLKLSFKKSIDFSKKFPNFPNFCSSYPPSLREYPITLVVGAPDAPDLLKCTKNQKLVTVVGASLPIPFGTHHTKMSILEDEDGRFHVIVSTANLVPDDWEFKTQQFYYNFGVKIASGTVPRWIFSKNWDFNGRFTMFYPFKTWKYANLSFSWFFLEKNQFFLKKNIKTAVRQIRQSAGSPETLIFGELPIGRKF